MALFNFSIKSAFGIFILLQKTVVSIFVPSLGTTIISKAGSLDTIRLLSRSKTNPLTGCRTSYLKTLFLAENLYSSLSTCI